MSAPMFSVKDLWAGYGEQQVLRGIHLDLHPGTITALIGANGAGKTTFLRTVSGLVKTTKGSAVLEGCSLTGLPPHRIVDQGFVQSPEGKQLFPEMTVMENLMVGASTPGRARAARRRWTRSSRCSPSSMSAAISWPAPCRAGSSRWSPWAAR